MTGHTAPANPREREALLSVSAAANALAAIDADASAECFDRVATALDLACEAARIAETHGISPNAIRAAMQAARSACARSTFLKRLQNWPRGYRGDFETIDRIVHARNESTPGSLEFVLESIALDSPICRQHRNKVRAQADAILRTVHSAEAAGVRAKICIIACGGSPDLAMILRDLRGRCSIVLNDADRDAIETSLKLLGGFAEATAVAGNTLRQIARLAALGPFDLVVAGGLFDYLPDRAARVLIARVTHQLLKPRGHFFFTNISQNNPYRLWSEYLVDWTLIERSKADLERLAHSACPNADLEILTDETGLAYLATMRTRDERSNDDLFADFAEVRG